MDSCLHVLVERYKDGKYRSRPAQQFEYVIQAGPAHRIEGFGQIYENHTQRAKLLNVFLLELSENTKSVALPERRKPH